MSKKILDIDEILPPNEEEVEYAEVEFPNGIVRLGSLSADEVLDWMEMEATTRDQKRLRTAFLIARSLVDKDGKRSAGDIGTPEFEKRKLLIRKKGHAWVEKVLGTVVTLNGLRVSKDDVVKNV